MLKLQSKNRKGLEFNLDKTQISLGRDSANDMVLDDPGISGFHANIFVENGKVEVVDLGSTNGTKVNGKRVSGRVEIRLWQELDVGGTKFELVDTERRHPTTVHKAVKNTQIRTASATKVRPATASGGQAIATLNLQSSGHSAPSQVQVSRNVSIGRNTENDVRIDSGMISSQHAKLLVSGGQVTLVDLGSTNGTRVNGKRITRQELRNGDIISFDEITYRFSSMLEDRGHTRVNPRLQQTSVTAAPTISSTPKAPQPAPRTQAPQPQKPTAQPKVAVADVNAAVTPEPTPVPMRAPEPASKPAPAPIPEPAPPPPAGGYAAPQKIEVSIAKPKGSILGAAIIMFFLSLLLFWLPFIGPLIAGIVGGKKAGGVGAAFVAVMLPAIIGAGIVAMAAGSIAGLPLIGAIAGIGGFVLSLVHIGPLMLGAIIGGAMA